MMSWIGLHKHGFCPHPPSPPTYSLKWRGDLIWKFAKILWVQHFFLNLWGEKPLWGELIFYGGVIFISPISLFYFFRNSQHPEKWSVSVKNFFRKCECISSCYLPISSILLKNYEKTFHFLCFLSFYLQVCLQDDLLLPHSMNRLIIFWVFWQKDYWKSR